MKTSNTKPVHLRIDKKTLAHCRDLFIQRTGERPLTRNGSESWSEIIRTGLQIALIDNYGGDYYKYNPSDESTELVESSTRKPLKKEELAARIFMQKRQGADRLEPGEINKDQKSTAFQRPMRLPSETFFAENEANEANKQISSELLSQVTDTNILGWENWLNVVNANMPLADYLNKAKEMKKDKNLAFALAAAWKDNREDLITENSEIFNLWWKIEPDNSIRALIDNPCYESLKDKISEWKKEENKNA